MNKLLIYFLSSIVVLLSFVIGLRFFVFSAMGNTTIKTYLQTSLKEQFSMPVKVYNFSLDEKQMKFSVNINERLHIDVITQYNMLTQYFAGIYYLRANDFAYKALHLRDANLSGRFKGRRGNMQIQGQGKFLDADLVYRFHVKDESFKHIEAKIKGLDSKEVFGIIAEDPLFIGNVDFDINLPQLGKDIAEGFGTIVLHKALFNTQLIEKEYAITLPSESYVMGRIDMKLEGKKLAFSSQSQSNIFTLGIEKAFIDVEKKHLDATYFLDMKNLELFTKNTLFGEFKIEGSILADTKKYKILGHSNSWGGFLGFEISETSHLKLQSIHLEKILDAMKALPYAKGLVTGNLSYLQSNGTGKYALSMSEGLFVAKTIDEVWGYQIPSINTFTLKSEGLMANNVIDFKAILKSSIGEIKLQEANYDITQKKVKTQYHVFFPNMGLLLRNNRAIKRGYISAKGDATVGATVMIHGKVKGLGGTVDFVYDENKAKVEASELFIEKILSLASASRYVTGKLKTKILLEDIDKLDGNFSFSSDTLRTQPRMIEKLLGKKVAIKMRLRSQGEIKEGNITLSSYLESKMANLSMIKMQIDTKEKRLKSPYVFDIPELKNAYELIGKKLYGPMKFVGNISYDKVLKIDGFTKSLGGKISYERVDKNITSQIEKVSLENILLLLGHDMLVSGKVSGDMSYDLQKKQGDIALVINDFHLNRSPHTDKLKILIGKDPTRILYTDTELDAKIDAHITQYTLNAIGSHSNIEIKGILDKEKDTHTGTFSFIYESYEVTGTITGSITKPKLHLDLSAMMNNPMGEKIQNKLNHALGDEMGKVVGGFLKGLKF